MRPILTLNSPIFDKTKRRQAVSSFITRQAEDFKNLTKRRMIESQPSGRFYRRSTKSDVASRGLGHRSSAKGQRPAIDTGNLLSAVATRRLDENRSQVYVEPRTNSLNKTPADKYAEYLQNNMNRPIMTKFDAEEAQRKATRDGHELIATLI